jgi:hypothetical protein
MVLTIGPGIGAVLEPKGVTTRPDTFDESGPGHPTTPPSDSGCKCQSKPLQGVAALVFDGLNWTTNYDQ